MTVERLYANNLPPIKAAKIMIVLYSQGSPSLTKNGTIVTTTYYAQPRDACYIYVLENITTSDVLVASGWYMAVWAYV